MTVRGMPLSHWRPAAAVVAAAMLACVALPAAAITPAQQDTLRNGRNPDDRVRWLPAVQLAQQLGQAGDVDAAAFLVGLGDRYLFNEFTRGFRAASTPQLEALVIAHRRDPQLGANVLTMARGYKSRALFEALRDDLRDGANPHTEHVAHAIVRTELPGIEAELAQLLPGLEPRPARELARALAERRYMPAEAAIADLVRRTSLSPLHDMATLAQAVLPLGSQKVLDALALKLAQARTLPPSPPEQTRLGRMTDAEVAAWDLRRTNKDLADFIVALRFAPAHNTLDRTLVNADNIRQFAPEHHAGLRELLRWRDQEEGRFAQLTPDNFTHWARQRDRIEELKSFIARGANVNARDGSRETPLLAAAKAVNAEGVRLLLAAGADPNVRDWENTSALHHVAYAARPDLPSGEWALATARVLLAGRADPSPRARDDRTPLHVAVGLRYRAMAELLVEGGADVNAEATDAGISGLTPTQLAEDQGDAALAAYLRSRGGRVNHAFTAKRAAARATIQILGPVLRGH